MVCIKHGAKCLTQSVCSGCSTLLSFKEPALLFAALCLTPSLNSPYIPATPSPLWNSSGFLSPGILPLHMFFHSVLLLRYLANCNPSSCIHSLYRIASSKVYYRGDAPLESYNEKLRKYQKLSKTKGFIKITQQN